MNQDRSSLTTFLRQSYPFPDALAEEIAGYFYPKALQKGELFLQRGRIADEYLYLEKGVMRSFTFDLEGEEVTLNLYTSDQVVFEVASFFLRVSSEESIEAATHCTGWALTFKSVNHLFHSIPEFREFGRAMLVRGFAGFKSRTLSMITNTAEERYEILLRTRPEIFQHVPLKHIASYLGITDTSLSRIRKSGLKK